jgi:hypothetical protein
VSGGRRSGKAARAARGAPPAAAPARRPPPGRRRAWAALGALDSAALEALAGSGWIGAPIAVMGCPQNLSPNPSLEPALTQTHPPPSPSLRADNWSVKAIRRKTTGTGRMQHLKVIHRRFKNGFQEGEAKKQA